ncbi:hypothetical protein ACGFMO_15865 [Streptomyces niveus]|uniref:hypothetical protein n=1 Tax=Streptomyces niveus TaxID=193462 RepID=UPI003710A19B
MDAESEELEVLARTLLDPESGNFTEEVSQLLPLVGTALLVMDRVTLDEPWRGRGLGTALTLEAILRLMPGCRAVACSPGITDIVGERLRDEAEWDRVNTKIAQGWQRLGFLPYRNSVYLLSPT